MSARRTKKNAMLSHATVTTEEVARLLMAADGTNTNFDSRKNATSRLRDVSRMGGFMTGCAEVWMKADNDTLRHLAIIQLKNNARWFYSKQAIDDIANIEVERGQVRDNLLQGFVQETNFNIAQQVALSLAKVARADWVKKNMNLVNKCCEMLVQTEYEFKGSLLAYEVFNELASLRLQSQVAGFKDISQTTIQSMYPVWGRSCEQSLQLIQQFTQGGCSKDDVVTALTKLKYINGAIQKLMVSGRPNLSGLAADILNAMESLLRMFGVEIYKQIPDDNAELAIIKERIGDIILDSRALVLECQRKYPYEFGQFLEKYLNFSMEIVTDPSNPRTMLTFAFKFLKMVYGCRHYSQRPGAGAQFSKKNRNNSRHGVKFNKQVANDMMHGVNKFFNNERIIQLVQLIVSKYFVLNNSDMEKWNADPEEFYQDTQIDTNERQVCSSFFSQLVKKNKEVIAPVVVEWFVNVLQNDASQQPVAVERDALYHAVGLGYFHLHTALVAKDFELIGFYTQFLRNDLASDHKFLQRRATWLCGKVKDDLLRNRQATADALQILVTLLKNSQDLVVRLTAVKAIRELVDNSQFESTTFAAIAPEACEAMLGLLNGLENISNITYVITSLKQLLEKFGGDLGNRTSNLLSMVNQLWDNYNHDLVRASVVGVIVSIVKAMKNESEKFHQFLIPVLQYVTDFKDDSKMYVYEVGLELWCAVMQNTSRMTPELLAMFECWVYYMDKYAASEHFIQCVDILKSYLLLGEAPFVQRYAQQIQHLLTNVISTLDPQGMSSLSTALCMFIQIFPNDSPQFLQPVLERTLVSFVELSDPITTRILKPYMMVLARLFFDNFQGGLAVVQNFERRESRRIMQDMLKRWMAYLDKIRVPHEQKLCLLALTNFVQMRDMDQSIYQRMVPVMMKCAVSSDQTLQLEENRNPILTEPQRHFALAMRDNAANTDIIMRVHEAQEQILSILGQQKFQKAMKKIPDHVIDKYTKAKRKRNRMR